ncbi:protein translocase subunit SecDF [Phaeocystidibacter luteus]|uniref:Multifunctional fusion protein n=1 Tax=Phaeocystidibacter luteus TaxID=911197 RepID=A0A6N6RF06_9FLAO|nr:protein translocase subunit SecDF [Phaeocystidibacter luteus]KAB2809747.1 protein translocase subunit SecDF [Phaeocystidibacter luteus]
MQNKGVIRLFAIVLALVCFWELSFTFVSNSVETNATEVANGDADKRQAILDSMLNQEVMNLGFAKYTYAEVKDREINLGLDLRGGMNVILEVSVRDILLNLADNSDDVMLRKALAHTDSAVTNSQEAYVEIFFTELDRLIAEAGGMRAYTDPALFGTPSITKRAGVNVGTEEVKALIRQDVTEAVDNVYTVLKARIDQFGVVQPNIQQLEGSGRILVEMPGVKDPDRAKQVISSTAKLEFWKAFKAYEVIDHLAAANTRLRDLVENPNASNEEDADSTSDDTGFNADDFVALDDADSSATDAISSPDSSGTEADTSAASTFNPLFELVSINFNQQTQSINFGPTVGFVRVADTAKVLSYLNRREIRSLRPANLRYVKWSFGTKTEGSAFVPLYALAGNRENVPELSGDVITDARQDFEGGRPSVSLNMDGVGANTWARLTERLSQEEDLFDQAGSGFETPGEGGGDGRRGYVAIALDGVVYSAPSVNKSIPGGRTSISGSFDIQEAQDLATVLRAGKLPVPTKIVQSDVIGPTLGAEAISASFSSFLIALLLVMVYMILYYNFAGIVADISLVTNMLFIFGIIAGMGIVLTLPGMAGIILTIGMAVDANVIIYERIREELANGKDVKLAIRDGYKHSYSAIIDANLTTLLTAIALFVFGTGPIRGFATTLGVGIVFSVFSAIFVTRLVYEWRLSRKASITFSTKFSEGMLKKVNIDFISKRKVAYIISGILIVISIASLATKGLNQGVDFVGGRSYTVRFDQPVDVQEISNSLSEQFVGEDGTVYSPIVKTLGEASQVVITTKYRIDETGAEVDKAIEAALYEGVSGFYASPIESEAFLAQTDESAVGLVASRQVGPTIADDIGRDAVLAVIFSLLAIFVYILVRFSKMQYSFGAIAAIIHDVIIVFGIFSIFDGILPFQLEVDQAFVAAILTVIGYSLNDTVVVFDRVREYYSHYHKKRSLSSILNSAMNGTLSRTVNTSMTTLIVLLIILIFGGESIRGFIFAITVGVVVGTYSSLFVATPVVYDSTKEKNDSAE